MRTVRVDKNREVEVPTSWAEGEAMLTNALGAYYDGRGGNIARLSIAGRVAHGMFGKDLMSPDPTLSLLFLLQRICQRRGAGLDGLEKPRRWCSTEEDYHCVNGHDRCHEMLPGPDCPYCERRVVRPTKRKRSDADVRD